MEERVEDKSLGAGGADDGVVAAATASYSSGVAVAAGGNKGGDDDLLLSKKRNREKNESGTPPDDDDDDDQPVAQRTRTTTTTMPAPFYTPGQQRTIDKARRGGYVPPKRVVKGGKQLVVVDDADIISKMKPMAFKSISTPRRQRNQSYDACTGRGFLDGEYNRSRRVREMKLMIDSTNNPDIHQQALQFVHLTGDDIRRGEGDTAADSSLHSMHAAEAWKTIAQSYGSSEEGEYRTEEGAVGWNAFKDFGSKLIQRIQRPAGNCFLHAPAVLQSYVIQQGEDTNVQVIDISMYAHHSLDDEFVSHHIIENSGGNAEEALMHMLNYLRTIKSGFDTTMECSNCSCTCCCPNSLFHDLKTYGPALVHCFAVEEKFATATVSFADDSSISHLPCFGGTFDSFEMDEQKHAMLLVGMRKDQGKWKFLLQNWWPDLQLVEVTEDYMASSARAHMRKSNYFSLFFSVKSSTRSLKV